MATVVEFTKRRAETRDENNDQRQCIRTIFTDEALVATGHYVKGAQVKMLD